MLRNKEVRSLLLIVCSITILLTLAAAWYDPVAAGFVLLAAALIITFGFLYTRRRYRELERLAAYLRQITSGDYALDVRDHEEGELSILRSEIYKVTVKLSEHSAQLQQDKLQLTAAISDISHQLKTPLTSMLVMVDLLSDDKLPPDRRTEFTRNISVQLERMEWLISSLLKLSKIDAGTVYFRRDVVEVKPLIHQALEPLLIPLDIKGVSLDIQGDPSVSFIGDGKWTAEALINMVKNAAEHTPEGGTIRLAFAENALYTEIVITDSGPGIPAEDMPYIFKRFYRGKHASEDSIGIGLAMAHSIIASQHGTIDAESQIGIGTTFRIKFYKRSD